MRILLKFPEFKKTIQKFPKSTRNEIKDMGAKKCFSELKIFHNKESIDKHIKNESIYSIIISSMISGDHMI